MSVTVDSFELLWSSMCRDLRPLRDALITLGTITVAGATIKGVGEVVQQLADIVKAEMLNGRKEDCAGRSQSIPS